MVAQREVRWCAKFSIFAGFTKVDEAMTINLETNKCSNQVLALILQNSISAENFPDKFSSGNFDTFPLKNNMYE
jgi:hypothetical protein